VEPALIIAGRPDDVVKRTALGQDIIRRDPRELPRRLRGLLLAVDGRQTVATYIRSLDGFGDVSALLGELMSLGLIELRTRKRARMPDGREVSVSTFDSSTFDSTFYDSMQSEFSSMEGLMNDEERMMHTLYDNTLPGSFDDMMRVAQADHPELPPAPPPAPVSDMDMQKQVDSLFKLLEEVRDERKVLKEKITQLRKYRQKAKDLTETNQRLSSGLYALAVTCGVLVIMLLFFALRR
jgi:hypothetical protein